MPITLKRRQDTNDADTDSADSSPATFTRFVYRSRWFVLAQTEGAELPEPSIPQWDAKQALSTLGVDEIPFDSTDGNVMGYARERSIAINPLNPLPHKTRFHELAHVLLGHTAEEAESVALLCCVAATRTRRGPWLHPALLGSGPRHPGTFRSTGAQGGGRHPEVGRSRRGVPMCTAPGSLDTHLCYAAWRSSYSSRASIGV